MNMMKELEPFVDPEVLDLLSRRSKSEPSALEMQTEPLIQHKQTERQRTFGERRPHVILSRPFQKKSLTGMFFELFAFFHMFTQFALIFLWNLNIQNIFDIFLIVQIYLPKFTAFVKYFYTIHDKYPIIIDILYTIMEKNH